MKGLVSTIDDRPQRYAKALNNIGITYGKLKRYDDAIKSFRQAIHIDPNNAGVWNNLGVAYSLFGNRTAAMDAVRELRRLDPEQAEILFNFIVPR